MFVYTRNKSKQITFWEALLDCGLSFDGVAIPKKLPDFSSDFEKMRKMSFYEIYAFVFSKFADEEISVFNDIFEKAWSESFAGSTVFVEEGLSFSEAFDELSESIESFRNKALPYLVQEAKERTNAVDKTLFVTSENSTFSVQENTKDLYSASFVSNESHVATCLDDKNFGVAIEKSKAEINSELAELCGDKEFVRMAKEKGVSIYPVRHTIIDILIGLSRLISSYFDLLNIGELENGQPFNVAIDGKNVFELISCIYAKKIGIPISAVIVADNPNKIALDFWQNGKSDLDKLPKDFDFYSIESLLYLLLDENDQKTKALFESFGSVIIEKRYFKKFDFVLTGYVENDEIAEIISSAVDEWDYVCSVSTARALSIYDDYCQETDSDEPTLIIADESPLIDSKTLLKILFGKNETDDVRAINSVANELGLEVPEKYKYTKPNKPDGFLKETCLSSSIEKIVDIIKGE